MPFSLFYWTSITHLGESHLVVETDACHFTGYVLSVLKTETVFYLPCIPNTFHCIRPQGICGLRNEGEIPFLFIYLSISVSMLAMLLSYLMFISFQSFHTKFAFSELKRKLWNFREFFLLFPFQIILGLF